MSKKPTTNGAMTLRRTTGLGWVRDLPDPRDATYSVPIGLLQALPAKVDVTPSFPVYDQENIGSCTANALAAAVEFDRVKNKAVDLGNKARDEAVDLKDRALKKVDDMRTGETKQ